MADGAHHQTEGDEPEHDPRTLYPASTHDPAHTPVAEQAQRNTEHAQHFPGEQSPERRILQELVTCDSEQGHPNACAAGSILVSVRSGVDDQMIGLAFWLSYARQSEIACPGRLY